MRIIIDTIADPTVHLVIAAACHILAVADAEPDTAAINSLLDLEHHFAAVDMGRDPNSSSGPCPCFLPIRYVPSQHPPISSSPAGQTSAAAAVVHPSH